MDAMDAGDRAALRRIVSSSRVELVDALADELAGADLTTVLLEVMRRRASRVSPADLMRRYGADRFVVPAALSHEVLLHAEHSALGALPVTFERIVLAPLVPLGTHMALGAVHQNRVVSTVRGSEVAADPTTGLALEAARRRRLLLGSDAKSAERVRLAATQRVVRGQRFEDPAAHAHFTLLGLVTAGRDTGNDAFERESAAEHINIAVEAITRAGARPVRVEVTQFRAGGSQLLRALIDELSLPSDVPVIERPDRIAGRGYYSGLCFKAFATLGDRELELADGGHVDWTERLVESRKERIMISGMSMDRLALATNAIGGGSGD
jgi:hypothetical protein